MLAATDGAAPAGRMSAELQGAINLADIRRKNTAALRREVEQQIQNIDGMQLRARQLREDTSTLRGRIADLESFNDILLALARYADQIEAQTPGTAALTAKIDHYRHFDTLLNVLTRFATRFVYKSVGADDVDVLMDLFKQSRSYLDMDVTTAIRIEILIRGVFTDVAADRLVWSWALLGGQGRISREGVLLLLFSIVNESKFS